MLNRMLRLTLVSTFALAVGAFGVANAQDADTDAADDSGAAVDGAGDAGDAGDGAADADADATGDGDAKTDEGGGDAAAGDAPAAAGSRKAVTKDNYPTALNQRPLVNPTGMIEANVSLDHLRLSVAGTSFSATSLSVGGSYGVMDKLEVGLSTGLGIDPDAEWSKSLDLGAWYSVMEEGSGGKLDVAAGVTTSLSFEDGADLFSGFTLHGLTRYHLGPKMFVTAGSELLEIQTADPSAISLDINLGFYYQVDSHIAAGVHTQPAHIKISGDANATTTYGDVIPFGIDVLYGLDKKIDAHLSIVFPSLEDAGDLMGLSVGATGRF